MTPRSTRGPTATRPCADLKVGPASAGCPGRARREGRRFLHPPDTLRKTLSFRASTTRLWGAKRRSDQPFDSMEKVQAAGRTYSRDTIKDRVSIHERPENIDARTEAGYWEGDLIICKRTRPVLVLYERKSRVTLAARLVGKAAAETILVMLAVFARIEPTLRKSITFDNDTAFAQHARLKTMCAMTTWFCDAYASWQKGGVENANGVTGGVNPRMDGEACAGEEKGAAEALGLFNGMAVQSDGLSVVSSV